MIQMHEIYIHRIIGLPDELALSYYAFPHVPACNDYFCVKYVILLKDHIFSTTH